MKILSVFPLGTNLYGYVGNSPTNATDPSGLWSPAAHDAIIRHAFRGCGVPESEIEAIIASSRQFEKITQAPDWAFAHSMRNPQQTVDEAVGARNDWIQQELQYARTSRTNGFSSSAMIHFGAAIHPIMDLTSPAHMLPTGEPLVWCQFNCSGSHGHSPADVWGREQTRDITEQDYALEDQALRDAYSYMTGRRLSCRYQ